MKKIFHSFLCFTFIFIFSSNAAENIASIITIKESTSHMNQIVQILERHKVKLSETVLLFDNDETLATTVGTYKDREFKLLPCPDKFRTYKKVFSAAFENSGYELNNFYFTAIKDVNFDYLPVHEHYEFLDSDVIELIAKLKKEALFVGVCSGLPANSVKIDFMKIADLESDKYIYGGNGKPQAVCGYLQNAMTLNTHISTIVLIDNSDENAIDPFLEKMPHLLTLMGLNNLKVIGIHFTKFSEMATEEAIREELTLLDILRK
ncbi:MAG: hypothetical protein ACOH2E_07460 [Candidatus Paracaedibacter sp.]